MVIPNADAFDSPTPRRVPVVDDEGPNRPLLRELLEGHGYAVAAGSSFWWTLLRGPVPIQAAG